MDQKINVNKELLDRVATLLTDLDSLVADLYVMDGYRWDDDEVRQYKEYAAEYSVLSAHLRYLLGYTDTEPGDLPDRVYLMPDEDEREK